MVDLSPEWVTQIIGAWKGGAVGRTGIGVQALMWNEIVGKGASGRRETRSAADKSQLPHLARPLWA